MYRHLICYMIKLIYLHVKKIINESDVCLRSYHEDMVLSLEGSYNVYSNWSLGKIKNVMKLYDSNRLLYTWFKFGQVE